MTDYVRKMLAMVVVAMTVACGPSSETVDAAGPSQIDAGNPTGELGDDCTGHGDCVSGYCVEAVGGVGGVCTRPCNDDCPADWECRELQLGETNVKLCIPNAPQLCLACATDTECGKDAACLTIDGAGSCATKCTTSCPTGYTCAVDATAAHAGTYCQPVIGSCTCSAGMEGAARACTTTNAIGTCYGTETCSASGWSTCSARVASGEGCDGEDNDCDFLIDEDVGGGESCTITVAGVGSCPGTRTCVGAAGFSCEGQTPTLEACNYADDDCDSKTDEAFPALGTLCSPGVGACQRFGSMRCDDGGTGVECSVVAAMPTTELCNQVDDDCDTNTDEAFSSLGTSCSAGLGVCARYGTTICSGDGLTTTCSATPGTSMAAETCNYLDDNCDGTVDNGFRNAVSGVYDTTANCGACGNDCSAVFTGQNSSGVCSTVGSPQCVMVCSAGTYDLNNSSLDGCEFVLDTTAVYVSESEASASDDATCGLGPSGTGGTNHPCRTIAFGMSRAASLSRPNVMVADGTYDEPVTLVSGRNLLGGYRPGTWDRHLSSTNTVIEGATPVVGNHDATVIAVNVTSATFEGFVVRGAVNSKIGGNSYAIYISGGSASLAIRNNQIFAGHGGPGASGTPGANGTTGTNGAGSVGGTYDAFTATGTSTCNSNNNRQFANGGTLSCGARNVSGGNGGGNRCTPMIDQRFSGISGLAGTAGGGAGDGSAGGSATPGYDGELNGQGANQICFIPASGTWQGADGNRGQAGASGAAVAGCSASTGSVVAGHWVGGGAVGGAIGSNGGGGGGGGAGGGAKCIGCGGKDRLGAHGGGGGSGGCAGTGGGSGGPGGGVFGIFVVGGSAPTLASNTILRGAGGTGGEGGIGGAGGVGGTGGAGGAGLVLCTGKGGRGGDGGNGGHGSGGGGGCGGSSFAIYTSGIGTPAYCSANSISGGSAGQGGNGGYSAGNSSGNGAAGVLQGCTSI